MNERQKQKFDLEKERLFYTVDIIYVNEIRSG